MTTSRRVPVTQEIDGEPRCVYFSPALCRQIPTFEPQDGDIIQVTYPRSGTHWVQQIIQLILSKGVSVETFNEFLEKAPFLEVQEVKTTASPRLLRTHFSMSKLRLSEKAKYIYVARNPWDSKIGFGDYFEHVLSGYSHRRDSNVFFVTYEELQTNKKNVVLRLAEFLGEHHRKVLEENEEVLQQVLEKSTVAFMKNFMTTNPKDILNVLKKNSPHLQPAQVISNQESCQSTDIHILRKGVVGDWKQHFTRENIEKMQTAIMERTKGSDIMDLWKCD
ncbi:hypothetical protein HPB47_002270 [Ixodes persulcatus]|uniref:Uncharacterized protein n=1 Tax=Ixodes persulcatus TaxID=34615 RepID=A0AC60PMY1_IXOPE|nr:hypothetical protein HPB47_002270 [Ixodes persulcatus]